MGTPEDNPADDRYEMGQCIAEIKALQADLAAAREELRQRDETIRLWERLAGDRENYEFPDDGISIIAVEDGGVWKYQVIEDGHEDDQLFDSPIAALRHIEAIEAIDSQSQSTDDRGMKGKLGNRISTRRVLRLFREGWTMENIAYELDVQYGEWSIEDCIRKALLKAEKKAKTPTEGR